MSDLYWKRAERIDVGSLCRCKDVLDTSWKYGVLRQFLGEGRYPYLIDIGSDEEVFELCEVQRSREPSAVNKF